jgi:UDP-glucose 4-epimerase
MNDTLADESRDFFSDRRVLITGGAGFIGSNLARRLVVAGAHVTLVDSLIPEFGGNLFNLDGIRDDVTLNITDVRDPYAMSYLVRNQDYLFNLAGQTSHQDSMTDPITDLNINAAAQLSILEACRKHNPSIKIIFASTRQIYGKPDYLPVDELHPVRPVDINGINKCAGEQYHLLYNAVYGMKSCVLRLTNTYGPGMRVKDTRQTFLGIWIRLLLEGKPILVFGDGSQLRDFNYIDDVVDALIICALRDEAYGRPFNLGGPERISLKALAELLVESADRGTYEVVPFPPERKAIDIGDYYGDYSLLTKQVGWRPRTPLAAGLAATLRYYAKHRAHYWDRAT